MRVEELLARLDGAKKSGGGWLGRCPSHQPDRNPSLSIRDGERGILLHCWAGCSLVEITNALGIGIQDLFYNNFRDPHQRQEARQCRAQEQAARHAAHQAKGRRADALCRAEHLIQSACSISIDKWSHAKLHRRLNALADAYQLIEKESHDA